MCGCSRPRRGLPGLRSPAECSTENVNVAVGPCPEPLLCKRRMPYCCSNLVVSILEGCSNRETGIKGLSDTSSRFQIQRCRCEWQASEGDPVRSEEHTSELQS